MFIAQAALPIAIANAPTTIMLPHLAAFFVISFSLAFTGFLLAYDAIRSLMGIPHSHRILIIWTLALILFFTGYFTLGGGLPIKAIWNLPAILLFFLPIHIMLFRLCLRWIRNERAALLRMGIIVMAAASLIFVVRDMFYIVRLLEYPSDFWFVVFFSDTALLALQLAGILLLFAGFALIHRRYAKKLGSR